MPGEAETPTSAYIYAFQIYVKQFDHGLGLFPYKIYGYVYILICFNTKIKTIGKFPFNTQCQQAKMRIIDRATNTEVIPEYSLVIFNSM